MTDEGPKYRKKLIEVALPLEAINAASAREKSIRHGHPSTLHLWWARRPLAACRAVLFAQLVDDPSSWPEHFPTEEEQGAERKRLHDFIGGTKGKEYKDGLVAWEGSNDEHVLNRARWYIARSLAWGRGEEPPDEDDPEAVRRYLLDHAPPLYDPFCGGGSIPLEAQRLGLRAYGSDLNPVAVMISKALVEFPPKFAGLPPVNPEARRKLANGGAWNAKGAQGLAEDVRYYGRWMRDEACNRIGHLYPEVELPPEHGGGKATVIAWLWARTVASPNPAARGAHVPLVSSFMLSTKPGKEAWIEPVLDPAARDGYRFEVRTRKKDGPQPSEAKTGTKPDRGGFKCLNTGTPVQFPYIRIEAQAGRMKERLMAIVAEGKNDRIYLSPSDDHEKIARSAQPSWGPEELVTTPSHDVDRLPMYGMRRWRDAFTPRQLVALTTFSDLVLEARTRILEAASASGVNPDPTSLANGGTGAQAYADALAVYLSLAVSRQANRSSTICFWDTIGQKVQQVFARQAIPMTWDWTESNPFSVSSGNFAGQTVYIAKAIEASPPTQSTPHVWQLDASDKWQIDENAIIATDPPYYDNIGNADLSDYFYVWLRRILRDIMVNEFATALTPKSRELVAASHRLQEIRRSLRSFS